MKVINIYNNPLCKTSCVYRIMNMMTGHFYIGSTKKLSKRYHQHKEMLKSGIHKSKKMQEEYDKYGPDVFVLEVLLICNPKYLKYYEQQLLDELHHVFNTCKSAYSVKGIKQSSDWIRKRIRKISKPVCVDGVTYDSQMDAKRALNLTNGCIYKRLNSKNFPNYYYL